MNTQTKYTHSHNSIISKAECLVIPGLILAIMIAGYFVGCDASKNKSDETVAVSDSAYFKPDTIFKYIDGNSFTYDPSHNFIDDIRNDTVVYKPIPRKKGKMKKIEWTFVDTSETYLMSRRMKYYPADSIWKKIKLDSSDRYWFIKDQNIVRVEGDHMARMNFPDSSITIMGDTMKLIRYMMNEIFRPKN